MEPEWVYQFDGFHLAHGVNYSVLIKLPVYAVLYFLTDAFFNAVSGT